MSTFVHVSVNSYRTAAGLGRTGHGSAGYTASGQVHETGLQRCCLEVSSHFTPEGKRVLSRAESSPEGTPLGRGAFSQMFQAQATTRDVFRFRTPITHVCNTRPPPSHRPPAPSTHTRTLRHKKDPTQQAALYSLTGKSPTPANLISYGLLPGVVLRLLRVLYFKWRGEVREESQPSGGCPFIRCQIKNFYSDWSLENNVKKTGRIWEEKKTRANSSLQIQLEFRLGKGGGA